MDTYFNYTRSMKKMNHPNHHNTLYVIPFDPNKVYLRIQNNILFEILYLKQNCLKISKQFYLEIFYFK